MSSYLLGLDYTNCPPDAVKFSGNSFVVRYFGYFQGYDISHINVPQGKVITPKEAMDLTALGISIVANYEWYNTRPLVDPLGNPYTGNGAFNAGLFDAQIAQEIALACGMPPTRPILMSYDYNTNGLAQNEMDYIRGVSSFLGLYRTGIYGPYSIVKNYFDRGLIRWAWQTYAWSGSALDPRVNIYQYQNGYPPLFYQGTSYDVDYDKSFTTDFGQWKSTLIDPSQEEDMLYVELNTVGQKAVFAAPHSGTLVAQTDFGFADIRVAIYHRNPSGNPYWEVIPDIRIDSGSTKTVIREFGVGSMVDTDKVSVVLSMLEPGACFSVEVLPPGY